MFSLQLSAILESLNPTMFVAEYEIGFHYIGIDRGKSGNCQGFNLVWHEYALLISSCDRLSIAESCREKSSDSLPATLPPGREKNYMRAGANELRKTRVRNSKGLQRASVWRFNPLNSEVRVQSAGKRQGKPLGLHRPLGGETYP